MPDAYDLWINQVCETENTSRRYLQDMDIFEKWAFEKHNLVVKDIPSKLREAKYSCKEYEKDRFLDLLKDVASDYFAYMKKIQLTHLSINRSMSTIMSFLHYFDIPIKPIRIRHPYVQYHNRDITKDEISTILDHSSVRNKAIYLMLYETGMRPWTVANLQWKHIKEDFLERRVPMKIKLTSDILKCGVSERFVFIGENGFEALKKYIMTKRQLPLRDDDYVFVTEKPYGKRIGTHALSQAFNVVVQDLKLAEPRGLETKDGKKNKPKELRLYTLRKAFSKFMAINVDRTIVEYWLGHTSTATHYVSEDIEHHRKLYAQGYRELQLEAPQVPTTILDELKKKDDEIKQIRQELANQNKYITSILSLLYENQDPNASLNTKPVENFVGLWEQIKTLKQKNFEEAWNSKWKIKLLESEDILETLSKELKRIKELYENNP